MAKKKSSKEDFDDDMDFEDLEGFMGDDDDFDFADDISSGESDDRAPSRSKVAGELAVEAGKGALEDLIKHAGKKALPEQYESSYYDVMDVANFTGEVLVKQKNAINKATYRFGKEVSKLMPFKIGLLEKYLSSQEEDMQSARVASEEEMRNSSTQSELTSIFDKQLQIQTAMAAREEAKEEIESKKQLARDILSQDVLSNIDANIAQHSAFSVQIGKEYYRRSLELQFKSFFVQADMLKTMREHYKAFSVQFTNIEKNTALPEFVKLKGTEKLHDVMREQTMQSIYRSAFSSSQYLQEVKKRFSSMVEEKVSQVVEGLDSAAGLLGDLNSVGEMGGGSSAMELAKIGTSMAGGTLGKRLAGRVPEEWTNAIKNNRYVQTGANYLSMLSHSPASLLDNLSHAARQKAEEWEGSDGLSGALGHKGMEGLSNVLTGLRPGGEKNQVKSSGYLGMDQPAILDRRMHRSISHAIPLYLSHILQTTSSLKTMYANTHPQSAFDAPLLSYDYDKRALLGADAIRANITKALFAGTGKAARSKNLAREMLSSAQSQSQQTDLSALKKLELARAFKSKKSDKLLSGYLEHAGQDSDLEFNRDNLIDNYQKHESLAKYVEQNPQLKKLLMDMKEYAKKDTDSIKRQMTDFHNIIPVQGVIELFRKTSILSGSPTPHLIKEREAGFIARIFLRYIIKTARDITPHAVLDRSLWMRALKNELTPAVREALSIFAYEVSRIVSLDDHHVTTTLQALMGATSVQLRSGDVNPQIFQEIYELHPELVETGEMDVANLREQQLKIVDNKENMAEWADISDIGKETANTIREKRDNAAKDNFLQRFSDAVKDRSERAAKQAEEMRQFVMDNKTNPAAILTKIVENAKGFTSSVSASLVKGRRAIENELKSLQGAANKLSENGITVQTIRGIALNQIGGAVGKSVTRLDEMIQNTRKDIEEIRENLRVLKEQADGLSTKEKNQQTIQAVSDRYLKLREANLNALLKSRDAMQGLKDSLRMSENTQNDQEVAAYAQRLRDQFLDTANKVKEALQAAQVTRTDILDGLDKVK